MQKVHNFVKRMRQDVQLRKYILVIFYNVMRIVHVEPKMFLINDLLVIYGLIDRLLIASCPSLKAMTTYSLINVLF